MNLIKRRVENSKVGCGLGWVLLLQALVKQGSWWSPVNYSSRVRDWILVKTIFCYIFSSVTERLIAMASRY